MAFRVSPTSPFFLGQDPPALRPKSPGEVGVLGETILGTSEKAQVDGRSLQERTVVTTIKCDRLIAQTFGSTSCRLPSLVGLADKWSRQR